MTARARVGKLAAWVGHGKGFEIREYPVPEPAPGAVVIRVSPGNVCGWPCTTGKAGAARRGTAGSAATGVHGYGGAVDSRLPWP